MRWRRDRIHYQIDDFAMLPTLVRGWDGDDESDGVKERRIVRNDGWEDTRGDDFADVVERSLKNEEVLKHVLGFLFVRKWRCNGCNHVYGYTTMKCGFDYWSEDLRFRSRLNRFHFIPYLSVITDARLLLNFFCDRCYESIFGNVVSLFQDCVWRDTILFKCSTQEHVADQWLFHTGGDVLRDELVSFNHFLSHIDDPYEPGFVALKLRHYDSMSKGSFKRTLLNKKIYSSERDVTSKVRCDNYYINYRREGQEYSFWVEKDVAIELFGLIRMEGPGAWTEGGRTFIFKNSIVYANACAVVLSNMYPEVRRDVFRRMSIEQDGSIVLIRNNMTSEVAMVTPRVPVDDLERFSHMVLFLERILKESRY
jgi:hypothetical protein